MASITPNATPRVVPNVTPNVTASVTPNITPNITPNVTASITPTVTPNREQSERQADSCAEGSSFSMADGRPSSKATPAMETPHAAVAPTAATTGAIKTHHFDLAFEAFIEDDSTRAFIRENNRFGYDELIAKFNEARERGFWVPRSNSVGEWLVE